MHDDQAGGTDPVVQVAPSPFSKHNPKLQLAWDSTSLRALMACPRRYQYSILEQWRSPGSVHTDFGGMFASALERGWKARAMGASRDEAQLVSLKYALEASGHYEGVSEHPLLGTVDAKWVPWGGMYMQQWKCTGTDGMGEPVPFKNHKGNKAKCPNSHKHAWFDGSGPAYCACGAETQTLERWLPNSTSKDRFGLIRLVVWYWEEQTASDEGLGVYTFPDGTPAVELSFAFPIGRYYEPNRPPNPMTSAMQTWEREPYLLCGHLDTMKTNQVEVFPSDNKTTGKYPGASYFAQYTPDVQMDTYDFATSVLYPDLPYHQILLECAQVLSDGAVFVAQPLPARTEAMRNEYMADLDYWLEQAEEFAEADHWPMNRASCYLCDFKKVCAQDPSLRDHFLKANFVKKAWNPLEVR